MSELIAFDIYRTEMFTFNGKQLTVHFTKRKDREEYELVAVHDLTTKSWKCSYSPETAASFLNSTYQELEEEVYKLLKDDVERGVF